MDTKRYFYDTEFLEDGETIDLISIGIVSEDGREYYAVNAAVGDSTDTDDLGARIAEHDWLMENVVPHLPLSGNGPKRYYGVPSNRWMPPNLNTRSTTVKPLWVIANEVREFLTADLPDDGDAWCELWAGYAAYDHVALAQLWGPMIHLPPGIPMFTHDIQNYAAFLHVPHTDLPDGPGTDHHALADAREVLTRYHYLAAVESRRRRAGQWEALRDVAGAAHALLADFTDVTDDAQHERIATLADNLSNLEQIDRDYQAQEIDQ